MTGNSVRTFFGVVSLLVFSSALAHADLITYTESGDVSGSLNGVDFTAPVVFTETSDTIDVGCFSEGFCVNIAPVSFSIPSLDVTATSTDEWYAFSDSDNDAGGFGDSTTETALLYTSDPSFSGYALATAFGPVTNTGFADSTPVETSAGPLVINAVIGDATFTATTGSSSPEPGTIGLLGIGLFVAGLLRRRLD